jgi:putative DNA primase/helicase
MSNENKFRLCASSIRASASGRWDSILISLGFPAPVLNSSRNVPCPCCGGTDRFQWIDKGMGRFVCRALERQGGDGLALVMHWLNCDFKTALNAVSEVLGDGCAKLYRNQAAPANTSNTNNHARQIASLWDAAEPVIPNNIAGLYLAERGLGALSMMPTALRYCSNLPYWHKKDGKPRKIGTFPALLAEVTAVDGQHVGLHRTYLNENGQKASIQAKDTGLTLPVKKLLASHEGASNGAAVRLQAIKNGKLALAEGIETALAVHLSSGLPCWACLSAGGLERVHVPAEATHVFIFADNDANQAGQRAAQALAARLRTAGVNVRLFKPKQVGIDWLDVLNDTSTAKATA